MKNILIVSLLGLLTFSSCQDRLSDLPGVQMSFPQQLSGYNIYQGNPSDLIPNPDYHPFELGSTLFADFSEKQRLIKLPAGTQMKKVDQGLPIFPDGTIIVKTFFYYHDKSVPAKGKRIIETRLLVKQGEQWNVATYLWDGSQTDATLVEDGLNTTVHYVDENGARQVLAYRIPSNRECVTCHSSKEELTPIGPKLRNLNVTAETPSGATNQITYFQDLGILDHFDPSTVSAVPNFKNTNLPLNIRARAYLDINCAHCHRKGGFAAASNVDLFFDYEASLEASNIKAYSGDIINQLNSGSMPLLGTSVLDEEGIELIKEYLNTIQ